MILTMDIGNTNIKCAAFEGMEPRHGWRLSTNRKKTHDEYAMLNINFLTHYGYRISDIEGIIVSSVVPSINYTIEQMCDIHLGHRPMLVQPGMKTGINLRYENPKDLGADRICNAVAAYEYHGAPCIYIDFGTATTFGVLSAKGEFLGGAICPGLKLSSEALTERAAQLPKIELTRPERIIARNTVANMQAGIVYGYVGQVEYIVRKMKKEMGEPSAKVLATGGMGRIIAGETNCIDVTDPELTLKGLRLLYERNKPER